MDPISFAIRPHRPEEKEEEKKGINILIDQCRHSMYTTHCFCFTKKYITSGRQSLTKAAFTSLINTQTLTSQYTNDDPKSEDMSSISTIGIGKPHSFHHKTTEVILHSKKSQYQGSANNNWQYAYSMEIDTSSYKINMGIIVTTH